MAPHSSVLAWKIPWMEEPGGLPSMGSHRVGHDWSNLAAGILKYRKTLKLKIPQDLKEWNNALTGVFSAYYKLTLETRDEEPVRAWGIDLFCSLMAARHCGDDCGSMCEHSYRGRVWVCGCGVQARMCSYSSFSPSHNLPVPQFLSQIHPPPLQKVILDFLRGATTLNIPFL